jgi:hypothetical protein
VNGRTAFGSKRLFLITDLHRSSGAPQYVFFPTMKDFIIQLLNDTIKMSQTSRSDKNLAKKNEKVDKNKDELGDKDNFSEVPLLFLVLLSPLVIFEFKNVF